MLLLILYFQPGSRVRLKPYIATALKMVVQDQEFGYYRLITSLDGTVDDDYIGWGEPLFYQLPDDHGDTSPIEPIDTSVGVPENMRDMFPRLSHLAKQQELLQRVKRPSGPQLSALAMCSTAVRMACGSTPA